jgi:UDP-glucose:(heptosyl)LPS alpha-1,3-glucosyltransferase
VRVAVVIERFEAGGGGVESAAYHLVSELVARDVDVTVVCREVRETERPGVAVRRLRVPRAWQPLRLAAFSRAAAAATRSGFDVVHGFSRTRHQHIYRAGGGSHAAYLEHVYRRPGLRRHLSPRHRAILTLEEAVFRDASQWIECNARRCADEIVARYGVDPARVVTIYNGVDTERFHPRRREQLRGRIRRELGLEGPVALFVGSGFERKGLDRAIDALARADSGATLAVAGRGRAATFEQLARRRGVGSRVRFLGERDDVEALHAAADLLLLPTRYDPFSNACLEAMASGLPVATTPVNGVAELIRHEENGLVFEEDFAPALDWLGDPARLAALGAAARATAEKYTWPRHAAATLDLYARVAA